jgi:hypothetical protein
MDPVILPEWLMIDKYLIAIIEHNAITLSYIGIFITAVVKMTPWKWDDTFISNLSSKIVDKARRIRTNGTK